MPVYYTSSFARYTSSFTRADGAVLLPLGHCLAVKP